MKLPVFLILSCLCVYAVCARQETIWGNSDWNVREIGTETVIVTSSWFEVKTNNFTFPRSGGGSVIYGVRHVDYKSHPVTVQFNGGGIGYQYVNIGITSQRGHGINSTFVFYTQK